MRRRVFAVVTCFALVTIASGCPQPNSVVGAWQWNIDSGCDDSIDGQPGMILDSDGNVRIYGGALYTGVWELNGFTINITIVSPDQIEMEGTLSVNGNAITNGIHTNGCWTAERIQP